MLSFLGKLLDRLEETIIALLMAAATLLIFFSVVHRYGTGKSIDMSKWSAARGYLEAAAVFNAIFLWFSSIDVSWAQELATYMFVWMAKFGAAYGVRTGAHVGVDVATNSITGPSRYWVIIFAFLTGAIFTFLIGSYGCELVYKTYHDGAQSNDLEAPMWIIYLCMPLGSYLMCFRFLQVLRSFAKTGVLPHTDEGHVEGLETVVPAEGTPGYAVGMTPAGGVQ